MRSRLSNGKCSLADAQFVIARVHGFASWPKFAKQIDEPVSDFELADEAIVEGESKEVTPLEGYERFHMDGLEYEAFNTSGGLGTLCDTLKGKVRERLVACRRAVIYFASDVS